MDFAVYRGALLHQWRTCFGLHGAGVAPIFCLEERHFLDPRLAGAPRASYQTPDWNSELSHVDSRKPDGLNSLHLPGRPADTRVVVAMSGGVDSWSALLRCEGYDVVGITLQLYDHGEAVGRKGACAGQDIQDARRVAEALASPLRSRL